MRENYSTILAKDAGEINTIIVVVNVRNVAWDVKKGDTKERLTNDLISNNKKER